MALIGVEFLLNSETWRWKPTESFGGGAESFDLARVKCRTSETTTFRIDNGDEARKGRRNPDVLLRTDKGGASTLTTTKRKCSGIFVYTTTSQTFCHRPFCISTVQLQCTVILDRPLRASDCIGTQPTHNWRKHLLVGQKPKPLIFPVKLPACSSSLYLSSFIPSSCLLWNSLPPDVSSSSSVSSFTLMLDSHFSFDRFTLGLS